MRYLHGEFSNGMSLCDSILYEIHIINRICEQKDRVGLFKFDFDDMLSEKPKEFGFLIRPTLKEYNDFISLLEKIICTHKLEFFCDEVETHRAATSADGEIIKLNKGSIAIFDEWVKNNFNLSDDREWEKVIKVLKDIRRFRQSPAHRINEDDFDQKYIIDQRKLLIRTKSAINAIRNLLSTMPDVELDEIKAVSLVDNLTVWPV